MALSRRDEFLGGFKAVLPLLIGVMPLGLIYGVLAVSAGIPTRLAQAMSVIVFAGSSQFIAAQLVGSDTPATIVILTIAVVNLRHALYSVSMASHFRGLSRWWKWGLAYLLTDEAYAVAITRYQQDGEALSASPQTQGNKHWYYLGAGLGLWSSWQLSTAGGVFIGAQVPASWSLDFTLALTFIALVVPSLKDRATAGAALTAGVTALLTTGMPYKLGLITAAVVGIGVGLWIEAKS